jgi:hypothetical protein
MRITLRRRRGSPFKPTPPRRRLVIVLLALGTSFTIGGAMMVRHIEHMRVKSLLVDEAPAGAAAEPPRCAPGQTTGCVGGTMGVIVVPAAPARSASGR